MQRRSVATLVVITALLLPGKILAQDAPADLRPGVAVFPFEDGGWQDLDSEARAALGVGLQQLLLNELARNQNLRIVERNALRQILEEQDLADQGRVDANTAVAIGEIVGARFVVLGAFSDLGGSRPMLTGRIVSVETSEILSAEQSDGDADALYTMVVELAESVTEGVDLPLLPEPEREALRSREIPSEALQLYSRAQILQDLGRSDQAIELYQRITRDFPAMTEAGEALRQLGA